MQEHTVSRLEIPPMRRDLVQEICQAALSRPQRRTVRMGEWLAGLFGEFRLPQPAYALAAMLVMGVCLGYLNPAEVPVASSASQSYSETLEDDGAWL